MSEQPAILRVTLPSDTSYLSLVSNLTRNAANAAGFGTDDAAKIALATDEAVTNVIQHAYRGERGRTIEVEVELSDRGIEVRIIHDGTPLDETSLATEYDPVRLIRDHRKGGLGIVLMRRLMDSVDFRATDDSRSACCLLKLKRPPEPAP